jgi:cytochrome c biogenesis protein CcmG/thiol:disulfide interchange protein DsbE
MGAETPTLGLAFIAGFLSFLSPCVLPLVPAYIGYMGGRMTHTVATQVALAGAGGNQTVVRSSASMRFSTLTHGIFFVIGFTLVFVAVGMILTIALGPVRDVIGRIGGVVIIFFGLHFMGVLPRLFNRLLANRNTLNNPFITLVIALLGAALILWGLTGTLLPSLNATSGVVGELNWGTVIALILVAAYLLWLFLDGAFSRPGEFWTKIITALQTALYSDTRRQMNAPGQRGGYLGSAVMGVVFAAGWTPCIGPILGSILGLAASASGGNASSAGSLLAAYSFGLGIPFLIAALALDSVQGVFRRLQRHMHKIELVTGGFLVFIGVLVASGQLQAISQQFTIQFGEVSLRVEDCGLATINGEIGVNYLGPCLSGELRLVTVGNTIQNNLTLDRQSQAYIFRGEADSVLDIEMRDRTAALQPMLVLLDEQKNELARALVEPSVDAEIGTIARISGVQIPQTGVYTVIASQVDGAGIQEGAFTIRVRHSEGEPATTSLNTITDAAASGRVVGTRVNDLAPDFESVTDTGEQIKLSDLRGKVVVLNFWATWCGPCKLEIPWFIEFEQKHKDQGFSVLGVSMDEEGWEIVKPYVDKAKINYRMVIGDDTVAQHYGGVDSLPTTFMIDQAGRIAAVHVGLVSKSAYQNDINTLLGIGKRSSTATVPAVALPKARPSAK